MKQKILFFIFVTLLSSCGLYAQREGYAGKTTEPNKPYLQFDFTQMRFQVLVDNKKGYIYPKIDHMDDDDVPTNLLEGKIKLVTDKTVTCSANGKVYSLKRVDGEILLNQGLPFLNDTLYLFMKAAPNILVFGRWKNGKKDGDWWLIKRDGSYQERVSYKDGEKIHEMKRPNELNP